MKKTVVLTIARQYGSGGREIGAKVAELLGIPNYDRELITMAAKEGELDAQSLERVDEVASGSLLYTLAIGSNPFGINPAAPLTLPLNDRLFVRQSEIIRSLAEQGSCVIIGRCADHVLREHPGCVRVYLYADREQRLARVMERHGISAKEADAVLTKTDRRRASYYNFYTGEKWGKSENYDLALNTGLLGTDGTARWLAQLLRERSES